MNIFTSYYSLDSIGLGEMVLRIVLAIAFGFIVGIDREIKNKPIDFRAYIIVAITSCAIAMIGQELAMAETQGGVELEMDLGKIIAGVLTGIGFLGAGAIIHTENGKRVVGTATGASIWAAGGMGLAVGFGFYTVAFIAFAAIALTLFVGGILIEKWYNRTDKETLDE